MKFDYKYGNTYSYNDNDYYNCYNDYDIYQIDTNNSYIQSWIADYYSGIEKTTLTGNYYPDCFTTKRIIVIQMK